MDYEEFIGLIKKGGIPFKQTPQTVFISAFGQKPQILVRWGRYNNEDVLLCYIDLQLNADGTLKDTVGVPIDLVTKEKVAEFIGKWKKLYGKAFNVRK